MEGPRSVKILSIGALCALSLALAPRGQAQSCTITNPTSSTVFLYPQAAQFTLSCSGVTGAYRAIWYIDYQRWAVGFNADQHQAILDWAEQWQGAPFAVQWQPALSGDGQHVVYAVVQNIFEATIATTPAVTFTVNVQGMGSHACITTAPPATSANNLPCPSTPITTMSGQGYFQAAVADSNFFIYGGYTALIDGEPLNMSYYGHQAVCDYGGLDGNNSPYVFIGDNGVGSQYPGLATWCWPNGPNLFQYGYGGDTMGIYTDPLTFGIPLPTSGSPSSNTIYFNPGNYPAGQWFYSGEPIVFGPKTGAPPAPLAIGGFACGIGSPSYWNCSANEITSVSFAGQTATVNLNINPITQWGASISQNVFIRNLPYTDQTSGQQPCDGQFTISAVTSSTIQFVEPSGCNTTQLATNLTSANLYPNIELWSNPYCVIYVDKNDIQLSSTFTAIQPPNAPPGSFQCGSAVPLTGSYSASATSAYGRVRSPYWSATQPGGGNEQLFGNDFMAAGSPPAFNTALLTFSNASAGMEIQPSYGEFHGYAGKSGDTLCPGGTLAILNTDYSNTSEPCSSYSFSFTQGGGVTGAISFNSSTGAITYNPTSGWSDPNHQTALAYVAISGNFCGPSHNAVCPSQTVTIENHGAAITFPSFSTCGVMATSFNVGLPANCQSFWPRSENVPSMGGAWPWKLLEDSNVNSVSIASYDGGSVGALTNPTVTSCPTWPDSYMGNLSTFLQQYNLYAEFEIADGFVSPNGYSVGYGAGLILGNVGYNRQSCLQSLISWMTSYPNNRFWQFGADDEVPSDVGANTIPNPSPTIANASSGMAAYLPSITSLGVSGGALTAVVTNIYNISAWSQSAGTGNGFQLTGLTTNSACNGWYLISTVSGTGPYTITAPVPSYLSGCSASSITDSGGVMNLPSFVPIVPPNAAVIPANPGQGCAAHSGIDCQKLSSTIYMTMSGSTATMTWPSHKLSTGQTIRIWSGSTANLNIIAPITVTGSNTFTFVYPGGTGGTAPTCTGTGGQCNSTTDPNAYITVDPGYGASVWNSMWSVIDGVASAPCHGYSLVGNGYGAGGTVVYNWMGNPANVSCGGMLYMSTPPINFTQPDTTNIQMSQYPFQTGSTYRPWLRYPRAYLVSDGLMPFVTQYCRSFGFNPACDKPSAGANNGLNWSPELAVTQMMSAKAIGVAGFRHYKSGATGQSYDYNTTCCGWRNGALMGWGYGNHMDPYSVPRGWDGTAHTYALLHAREDTELQPEANKPFLNYYTITDAHTSATYGNETTLTGVSSYHCGAQALPLNPIAGGSLILYLLDGYTLRTYTSSQLSWLAGNPSSVTPPVDWCVSPINGQQSPGLTWVFVSLPANSSPLDSMTFSPPATLPFGASKFLIQVGYYPEDMRGDPVTDCTSTCTIGIDHHNLNAWYRVIYADANGIPKSIGQPVEVAGQGRY